MAYDDIIVWRTGMQGPDIRHFPMDAGAAFAKGEPVVLASTGEIQEALSTAPIADGLLGIAMGGPTGPGAITLNDPATNTAYADNAMIPVVIPTTSTLFATKNWTTDETTFDDVAPAVADIGQDAALAFITPSWGIDVGPDSATNTCRIVDMLNVRRESLNPRAGGTASTVSVGDTYWIIFQIVSHMGTSANAVVGQASPPIGET